MAEAIEVREHGMALLLLLIIFMAVEFPFENVDEFGLEFALETPCQSRFCMNSAISQDLPQSGQFET